jgi:hypothetical protein
MLDIFNIPGQQDNVKIFYAGGGTNDWQTWQKPRGCKFIWMMCMGGGSGGGASSDTLASPGGGSGAVTKAIFSANVLPDTLFIQPGLGGLGAVVNNGQGGSGNRSFVAIVPSSAAIMNIVCVSGTTGAVGSSTSAGNGIGETAATLAVAGLLSLGNFTSTAGVNCPGGVTAIPLTSTITSPGINGGGTTSLSNPGSSLLSVDFGTFITPQITGGTPKQSGNPGADGIFSWKPMYSLGGAGGAGSDTGTGGKGGDGAYGSGGGGAGGSTSGVARGGRGGDGLVIIATF